MKKLIYALLIILGFAFVGPHLYQDHREYHSFMKLFKAVSDARKHNAAN